VTVEREYPAHPPPVHHTVLAAVVLAVLPVDKSISVDDIYAHLKKA
jgi:hypothetical protein